jgi:hypothetical protein
MNIRYSIVVVAAEDNLSCHVYLFAICVKTLAYTVGFRGCFPGPEADHSPPSCAEVTNMGTMLLFPHTSSRLAA